jgi:predicted TIM-barrel fold metal-dependent hydrolase
VTASPDPAPAADSPPPGSAAALDGLHLLDPPPEVSDAELAALPPIVSVDDHVVEPPDLFAEFLPRRWRDHPDAPRVERRGVAHLGFEGGTNYQVRYTDDPSAPQADCWVYAGVVNPLKRHIAAVGYPREQMTLSPATFDDMRPGCFDPAARLADMDLNGVHASVCFPTMARFAGTLFLSGDDRDLALACVRAYNDWMLDAWSATDPQRLVPLAILPLWDVGLASAELERVAARGVRAVAFPELVHNLGLPSLHSGLWDELFAVANAADVVLCAHIGTGASSPVSSDGPPAVQASLSSANSAACLADFIFSGVLERFGRLRLSLAEGQVGWLPFQLERMDDVWREHRAWGGVAGRLSMPPSGYFRRQVFGCFFRDPHGVANLDAIGVGNVTFETDYPHTDSTFPFTRQVAASLLRGVRPEVVEAVLWGNATRMLGLDPPPGCDGSVLPG